MARRSRMIVAGALVMGIGASGPAALAQSTPCAGRYLVTSGGAVSGTLEIGPGVVSLPGVCNPIAPKVLKATKKGTTKLKAQWPISDCVGLTGKKAVLAGKIVESCTKFAGKLKARKTQRKIQALLTRCGDGTVDVGAGETCDPPDGGACNAGCRSPGQLLKSLGVISFTLDVPTDGGVLQEPFSVTLNGAEGVLGTITSFTDHDAIQSEFLSAQGERAALRLHGQDLTDASPPRQVRAVLELDGRLLEIDLAGLAALTEGSLSTVTLRTTADQTSLGPSVGTFTLGQGGTAATVAPFVDGQQVVDEAALRLWFEQTGLDALGERSWAATALLASTLDLGLLYEFASHFDDGLAPVPAAPQHIHPLIHKDPYLCEGLTGLVGGPFEGATGAICTLCAGSLPATPLSGGVAGILSVPSCLACYYAGSAAFGAFIACKQSEWHRTTEEDCKTFPCDPSKGEEPLVDERTEHRCHCKCNDDRCNAFCPLYTQTLGTTWPDGSPRPSLPAAGGACVNNSCVCSFTPDDYCKAHYQNYCGGGRRLGTREFEIECPRATCGDNRFDGTCENAMAFAEKCDASAGDAGRRGSCAANQGCNASCACVDCACGPGTATPTCPVGDKGGYCGPDDCQCHQGCLDNDAHCPAGKTCKQGFCLGGGELRFTLDWVGDTDLDLHVLTPLGNEIFYGNTSADGGVLDVDSCVSGCSAGVENVFFSSAPAGTYTYWARNFDGQNGVRFNLAVITPGGDVVLKEEFIAASSGADSTHFTIQIGP